MDGNNGVQGRLHTWSVGKRVAHMSGNMSKFTSVTVSACGHTDAALYNGRRSTSSTSRDTL